MNGYDLSRAWFNFCFENPDIIKPNHTAVYFFAIEHCNRLGWKVKFGFPTVMAMEATGIKSYNTYKNTIDDLVKWGFVKMVERSKNQFSSNIIALSYFDKALDESLDKALIKHTTKQSESTVQSTGESISSIYKQETIEPITTNQEQMVVDKPPKPKSEIFIKPSFDQIQNFFNQKKMLGAEIDPVKMSQKFWNHYESNGWKVGKVGMKNWQAAAGNWINNQNNFNNNGTGKQTTDRQSENDIYLAAKAAKLRGDTGY